MKVIIAALILLAMSSCGGSKKKAADKPATPNRPTTLRVEGFVVKTQALAENIEVPGTLLANEVTEVHPEVAGRIIQLNVAEGKYVSKGTLLAKLYDADLLAQLHKIEVQLSIAQKTEERQMQLLKIQGISQQDYDLSLLQVNSLKADMEILRTSISKTAIRAPFSGKLGLKNISPGAYVTPASVIAVINQTDQLKLDFTVPEKYTGKIKVGQVVGFSREGSAQSYTAKISATELSVTETTRSLMVRSLVQGKDASLLPGAFAKVQLSFDPDPNAILIPTQAVVPQARGKKVVVARNGVAKFVEITTGVRDSARIQVITGLNPGDTIVTTGLLSIKPDAKIQIGRVSNSDSASKKASNQ